MVSEDAIIDGIPTHHSIVDHPFSGSTFSTIEVWIHKLDNSIDPARLGFCCQEQNFGQCRTPPSFPFDRLLFFFSNLHSFLTTVESVLTVFCNVPIFFCNVPVLFCNCNVTPDLPELAKVARVVK